MKFLHDRPKKISYSPERNLGLLLTATTLSSLGSAMVPVALTFGLLERGFGATGVGVTLGVETAAMLLLLVPGGMLADAWSTRWVMLLADLARMLSEVMLAWLLIAGQPALWQIAALAAVLGAGEALYKPARFGLLAAVAPSDGLRRANALFGIAGSVGEIGGPALAGILVAVGGAGWAIGIDAATFAVSVGCLASLRVPSVPRTRTPRMSSLLRDGWLEFAKRDWLWVIVCQFGLLCVTSWTPFMVNGAVLVQESGGGAAAWGWIMAADGLGGFIGGLLAMHMVPRRPMFACEASVLLTATPIIMLAIGAPALLVAFGAALSGIGMSLCNALWNTTLQYEIPPEALSRVKAYEVLGSNSLMPIGYAAAVPMATIIGATGTLWLGAFVIVGSTIAILCMRSVRDLRWR